MAKMCKASTSLAGQAIRAFIHLISIAFFYLVDLLLKHSLINKNDMI